MSAPADVLATLDAVIERSGHVVASDIAGVRAAVAEFIEANDAEYAAYKANLRGEITPDDYKRATQRRRAALARVKGESA